MSPAATAEGPKPPRISWSRLRLHSECPAKGALIAAGRKSPVTDIRNFFPGTVADRCMRQWLSLEVQERGWMAAQVDLIMLQEEAHAKQSEDGVVKWRHRADRDEVRQMCAVAVGRLEDDLWGLLRLREPPEERMDWDPAPRFEVPVMVPHPNGGRAKILLVGEIDLLVREPPNVPAQARNPAAAPILELREPSRVPAEANPGAAAPAIQVWDLKTTRDNQYWRKTLGQLVFYEIATWAMTKTWPERSGLLQPLCDETMPSWQFTMDHRTQMLTRIVAVAADMWLDQMPPKPEKGKCAYCEVRHACPAKGGGRGRVAVSAT